MWFGKYKVLISQTSAEHAGEPSKDGKFRVLTSSMKVIEQKAVCTHSYILAGNFENKMEADNLYKYLKTKFVRFLVLQALTSIHVSRSTFEFVPVLDFSEEWNDKKLYKRFGLKEEEIEYIENTIKPME